MRAFQSIVSSWQLNKIVIPKPLSILHIRLWMFTPLLSAATPLHSSTLMWQLLQLVYVNLLQCPSTQYLNLCQALGSMGHTISLSLTLGWTFDFNLGTNLFHLKPLSNDVHCNSQLMNIVKKTTHRSAIKLPEIKETTIGSVHNESPDIPVGNKDEL